MTSPGGNDRRALAAVAGPALARPQRTPGPPRAKPVLPHGWAIYLAQVAFEAGGVARRPPASPGTDELLGHTSARSQEKEDCAGHFAVPYA
jgi:hypothetical protein